MRLFKHGDSLAIVIPNAICKKLGLGENSELEFFEVEEGLLALASKACLEDKVKKSFPPSLQPKQPAPVSTPHLLVFATEAEARAASKKIESQLRRGEVMAVFGSDKKYYFISAELYSQISGKLAPFLATEKTLQQLAADSNLQQRELVAVIAAMKEKGEIIERKKGSFLLVK